MMKLLFKKLLPTVVVVALLVLGGLWLYGFCGVKFGWIGATKVHSLNAISQHGAETAGGSLEASSNGNL